MSRFTRGAFATAWLGLVFAAVVARAEPLNLSKANEGYTYFNRSGASAADYDREFGGCLSSVISAMPQGKISKDGHASNNLGAPWMGGILPALMADLQLQSRVATNLQNCMTVGGWRVMRLDDIQGAALWKLERRQISAQLAAWVGAREPPGQVVRTFANDAAKQGVIYFAPSLVYAGQRSLNSLSLKAFDTTTLKLNPAEPLFRASLSGSKYAPKALKPAELGAIAPDSATYLVSFSGKSFSVYGEVFDFRRVVPGTNTAGFDADGRPDQLTPSARPTFTAGSSKVYAFAAPPGTWRLVDRGGLELCMGAPSFEAKAGEVVYLGDFDLSADMLVPNLKLDAMPARTSLPPDLAGRVRPAAWVNGATWPCHAFFAIYALEFEGFPRDSGPRAGQP